MVMGRARLLDLLQRARRALQARWRRQLPAGSLSAGAWFAGRFRDGPARRVPAWRAQRDLDYWLFLPPGRTHSERVPLIVMLHGCQQDAQRFAAGTRMNAVAGESLCAVLYPQQARRAHTLRCWNWYEPAALRGEGEAGLIRRLVHDVQRRQPIDPQRIYVAGMSAGAALAGTLAVRFPDLFAACALHSGLMHGAAANAGDALRAMRAGAATSPLESARQLLAEAGGTLVVAPTLVVHGADDRIVSPRNAMQIVQQRLALARMPVPEQDAGAADGAAPAEAAQCEAGGRRFTQRDYAQGATLMVRCVIVDGLAHAWSGGDAQQPDSDAAGPDASRLMLDFLLRHRLREPAAVPADPQEAAIAATG